MPRERYVTTRCVAGLNRARRKADDRERVFVTTHHSRVMSVQSPKGSYRQLRFKLWEGARGCGYSQLKRRCPAYQPMRGS